MRMVATAFGRGGGVSRQTVEFIIIDEVNGQVVIGATKRPGYFNPLNVGLGLTLPRCVTQVTFSCGGRCMTQ
jgi:hypothetical protein